MASSKVQRPREATIGGLLSLISGISIVILGILAVLAVLANPEELANDPEFAFLRSLGISGVFAIFALLSAGPLIGGILILVRKYRIGGGLSLVTGILVLVSNLSGTIDPSFIALAILPIIGGVLAIRIK